MPSQRATRSSTKRTRESPSLVASRVASRVASHVASRVGTPSRPSKKRKAEPKLPHCPPEKRYIGIDIGTAASGVAYKRSDDLDEKPASFGRWPIPPNERGTNNSPKVPTAVLIKLDVNCTGWGPTIPAEVGAEEEVVRWIKLGLPDEADLPEPIKSADIYKHMKAAAERYPEGIVGLLTAYLTHLWEHVRPCWKGTNPNVQPQEQVAVCVPAGCTKGFQEKLREAATAAGIPTTNLQFFKEPEAAVVALMFDLPDLRMSLVIGDHIVTIDMGGGTVDGIAHTIVKTDPMLDLMECVPSQSIYAGAGLADTAFRKPLKEKFEKLGAKVQPEEFERIYQKVWVDGFKKDFAEAGGDGLWPFNVKVNTTPPCANSIISFTFDEIKRILDPLVKKIADLLDDLLNQVYEATEKHAKCVLFVGGFSMTPYMVEKLAAHLPRHVPSHQAGNELPITAVCRGAVHMLLGQANIAPKWAVNVSQHLAPTSLGFMTYKDFKKGTQKIDYQEYDDVQDKAVANRQVQWLTRQGKSMTKKTFPAYVYLEKIPSKVEALQIVILEGNIEEGLPLRYTDTCGATVDSYLNIDTSKLDTREMIPVTLKDMDTTYVLKLDIEIFLNGNSIYFRNFQAPTSTESRRTFVGENIVSQDNRGSRGGGPPVWANGEGAEGEAPDMSELEEELRGRTRLMIQALVSTPEDSIVVGRRPRIKLVKKS